MTPRGSNSVSEISDTPPVVSARADALAEVAAAAERYRWACQERANAEAVLNDRIYKARLAKCTVRATAAAAGMGKTITHQIMRYGQRGWA